MAKEVSEWPSAKLGKHVVVTVGIHWDDLSREAIAEITDNCRWLAGEIYHQVNGTNHAPRESSAIAAEEDHPCKEPSALWAQSRLISNF